MYRNTYGPPITSLTTVPSPVAKTGTLTSSGTVVKGTGTDFKGEDVREGDFIWDAAQGEIRKIVSSSYSSQLLEIDTPFTADLAAVALVIVKAGKILSVSFANSGAANGLIDGNAIIPFQTMTMKRDVSNRKGDEHIDPVIVDGTGTTIEVLNIK